MSRKDETNRRKVLKTLGAAGSATVFSGVATAQNRSDEQLLKDEEMGSIEEYRYAYKARRLDDFKAAVRKVKKEGYHDVEERKGIRRSGSMLAQPVHILSYTLTSPNKTGEAVISISFDALNEPTVGVRIDSDKKKVQTATDSSTQQPIGGERFIIENDEALSLERASVNIEDESPVQSMGSDKCKMGSKVLTTSGNDACYAITAGLWLTTGLVTLLSPVPGDEAIAAVRLKTLAKGATGGCLLYTTAKREFEDRGKDCDEIKFHVCVYQPTIWSTPMVYVTPECKD